MKQNEFPHLKRDVYNASHIDDDEIMGAESDQEDMDIERKDLYSKEELDNDMDEDYKPGSDMSDSDEDSDSEQQLRAHKTRYPEHEFNHKGRHANTCERNPQNKQK